MIIFLILMKITFSGLDKWVIQMLYCNRVDLDEGIDVIESNNSKE